MTDDIDNEGTHTPGHGAHGGEREALLPCPFCNGRAEADIEDEYARIRCLDCGTEGSSCYYTEQERGENHYEPAETRAIAAWNTRATLAAASPDGAVVPVAATPPIEPDGRMWSTGRAEFIRWAQRYEDARSADKASVIADVAGSEIWRAMYRSASAATPQPPAPLTDEVIEAEANRTMSRKASRMAFAMGVRFAEAAHKIGDKP